MTETAESKDHKERKKYTALSGKCPVDGSRAEYVLFSDDSLDARLVPNWYPFSVRVCSSCLTASSESDFLNTAAHPVSSSLTESLKDSYGNRALKKELMIFLPLKLQMARDFMIKSDKSALEAIAEEKEQAIASNMGCFLKKIFPKMPEANASRLAGHFASLVRECKDSSDAVQQILRNAEYRKPANHPEDGIMSMHSCGASLGDIAKAAMIGPMISSPSEKQLDEFYKTGQNAFLERQALLHLAFERLSIYSRLFHQHHGLKKDIGDVLASEKMSAIEEAVLFKIENNLSNKEQQSYNFLNLGRNFYKTYLLAKKLQGRFSPSYVGEDLRTLGDNALYFLELSLLTEPYPELISDETIASVSKKGNVKVPFPFGEFGIKHMLCCLYDAMGDEENAKKLLLKHWRENHHKFKSLDFGRISDPDAISKLIPRVIAMAGQYNDKGMAESLKRIIHDKEDGVPYAMYLQKALEVKDTF